MDVQATVPESTAAVVGRMHTDNMPVRYVSDTAGALGSGLGTAALSDGTVAVASGTAAGAAGVDFGTLPRDLCGLIPSPRGLRTFGHLSQ